MQHLARKVRGREVDAEALAHLDARIPVSTGQVSSCDAEPATLTTVSTNAAALP